MQDAGDVLGRLERWYAAQCNGDWEHTYGITIETLDNPGWTFKWSLGTHICPAAPSKKSEGFSQAIIVSFLIVA